MSLESQIGEVLGITQPGTTRQVTDTLTEFDLPTTVPEQYVVDDIISVMLRDKKNRDGSMRFSTINTIGKVAQTKPDKWTFRLPEPMLRKVLRLGGIS